MKILLIDTSASLGMTSILNVSSQGISELLSMNLVSSSSSHSERLFSAVDRVLKDSSTNLSDISKIIYSAGPGSFTGLRIAYSAVKGFALGAEKEIVGVSSLKALVINLSCFECARAALIADTKGEVFAYIVDNKNKVILDECSIKIEDLCKKLRDISTDVYCVGSGALLYSQELKGIINVLVPQNHMLHILSPFSMYDTSKIEQLTDLNYIKASYAESKKQ